MALRTRLSEIHELELVHKTHVHNIELIVREEETRRLKVDNLLLRSEMSDLQGETSSKVREWQAGAEVEDNLRAELEEQRETCRDHAKRIKQYERDIARLQVSAGIYRDST